MLIGLKVENYTLIQHLEIRFFKGYSVITGETGAGKSILLDALGLIMGNRADLATLKDAEKKCVIEAFFNVENYHLKDLFLENDWDYERETIIRREILPSGKSRAFINDSPVNLSDIQLLTNHLIDIHTQVDNREIESNDFQFFIFDSLANNFDKIFTYKSKFKIIKLKEKELKSLKEEYASLLKESDYNNHAFEELEKANFKLGEQSELEEVLNNLSNVELISENLNYSNQLISNEEIGIAWGVKNCKNALQKIANFNASFSELYSRLNSVSIEIEDINITLNNELEKLTFDPDRLSQVNDRLQLIYFLQKKHNVTTVDELIFIKDELQCKVSKFDNFETEISCLEEELKVLKDELTILAQEISEKRKLAIPIFKEKVLAILSDLGMSDADFSIQFNFEDIFFENGKDRIEMLFKANKGGVFGVIKKVASGGEIARIMLAVKTVLADYVTLPTIIFDEIDTGVSGEIAKKMGEIMGIMSKTRQVFAITHLPQVASQGQHHYKVQKSTLNNTTISSVELLNDTNRINEIATMISGNVLTDSAINHAKVLLNK